MVSNGLSTIPQLFDHYRVAKAKFYYSPSCNLPAGIIDEGEIKNLTHPPESLEHTSLLFHSLKHSAEVVQQMQTWMASSGSFVSSFLVGARSSD
jgi:hypothetical protein